MPVRRAEFRLAFKMRQTPTLACHRQENIGHLTGRDDLMEAWMHRVPAPIMNAIRTLPVWPLRSSRACARRPANRADGPRAAPQHPTLSLIFSYVTRLQMRKSSSYSAFLTTSSKKSSAATIRHAR